MHVDDMAPELHQKNRRQNVQPAHESDDRCAACLRSRLQRANGGSQPHVVFLGRFICFTINNDGWNIVRRRFLQAFTILFISNDPQTFCRQLAVFHGIDGGLKCCAARRAEDDEVHALRVQDGSWSDNDGNELLIKNYEVRSFSFH